MCFQIAFVGLIDPCDRITERVQLDGTKNFSISLSEYTEEGEGSG